MALTVFDMSDEFNCLSHLMRRIVFDVFDIF